MFGYYTLTLVIVGDECHNRLHADQLCDTSSIHRQELRTVES